ncbi:MAG: HlyD family efflux transporter periplasmic adaptor subunit [Alphaproteobacteria bacterium]|nr:HlyD family efflux transporter periplasmic adaptor subunit [Alphaproteobacteria bacterium]
MRVNHTTAVALALVLAACGSEPESTITGYAEGEYVYVAAPEGGWVSELLVARGAQVRVGDPLFALDAETQVALRDQAAAQVRQAEAQLLNLETGRRPDEIAALEAALAQANANRTLADAEFKRAVELNQRGFVSQAAVDTRRAQRDAALMQVKQTEANLALGRKGARSNEIGSARAAAEGAKAALARAEYALSQRRIRSKVAGRVEDTLRRAGEYVPPGGAIVQILPPQNVKLRFFVPERLRAKLSPGFVVGVTCDGCAKDLKGRVTFIASTAEFTPPVIYSVGSREKLVWMVEAVPEGGALAPGQPIDVTLP